jgi:hypothetical protein
MLGKVVAEALNDLEQIRLLLLGLQSLREKNPAVEKDASLASLNGVSASNLKLFEYCTATIRTYTIFERLIYSLAETWITWVLKNNAAIVLANPACRIAYEIGLAEIFRRQAEARFADTDRFALAKSHALFNQGLKIDAPPALVIAPFVATLPNLRMDQISFLFASIALGSPTVWLDKSISLLRFRDEYSLSYSEALKDVVQRRNEVAHGNPDPGQTLGTNELLARIDVISKLIISLRDYVISIAAQIDLGEGFERGLIGKITHLWINVNAAELTLSATTLAVGEKTLVVEGSECFLSTVQSIQLEGANTAGFSGASGTPLGVQMSRLPKEGSLLLRVSSLRDFEMLIA